MADEKKARFKHAGLFVSACLVFCLAVSSVPGQQKNPVRLSEIAGAVESYRGSNVSMKLKLKTVDKVFERIVFYDEKNHDIVFDISARATKKRLAKQMTNIHEGMDYIVTFKVDKTDNNGMIMAEIVDFWPVILDRIP